MTLQVALVGTDGIVLASDYLVGTSHEKHITSQQSKILRREDQKIIACWSGDKDPSRKLADDIVTILNSDDFGYPYPALKDIATNTLDTLFENGIRYDSAKTMVVTVADTPKLYEVITRRNTGLSETFISCECSEIRDKCIMGHRANPATFFAERYYEHRPIEQLASLAAHTILTGGRINSTGIKGLEMIRCTKEGFDPLNEGEIASLTAWSKRLDTKIGRYVLSGPHP